MTPATLEEVVGQVKAHVADLVKSSGFAKQSDVDGLKPTLMSKAEYDERFKKLETDLSKALKALEDETVRKTTAAVDGAPAQAAKFLLGEGYNAIKGPTDTESPNFAKTKPLQGVQVLDTDPMTGQTRNAFIVPDCVRGALRRADEVYIVDRILEFSKSKGPGWRAAKAEKGERAAFLERFPVFGRAHDEFVKAWHQAQGKALTTSGAGTGLEWIPSAFSSSLFDQIRLTTPLVNLIPHVNQPANPWVYPLLTGVGVAYRKTELAAVTASDLSTANRTWLAHVLAVYQAFSDEVSEDSIISIVSEVRSAIIRALGEGIDEAIMNGDSDNAAHFDNDFIAAAPPFRTYQGGFRGLRQFALDSTGTGTDSTFDCGTGPLTFADVAGGLALMGKFGATRLSQGEVALVLNTAAWLALVVEHNAATGVSSPIVTLDKYGPNATLLTGELARIFGVPAFISHGLERRKGAVAATGQNTIAGPNTLSCSVLFNRFNWRIGDRRDFRLETDRDIVSGRNDMVGSIRLSMNSIEGDPTAANWNPQGLPAAVVLRNHA